MVVNLFVYSLSLKLSNCRCEVQYEYGLLQQRHMPLSRRPTSFKSVNGKEIQVKTDVAYRNNAIMTKGKVNTGWQTNRPRYS